MTDIRPSSILPKVSYFDVPSEVNKPFRNPPMPAIYSPQDLEFLTKPTRGRVTMPPMQLFSIASSSLLASGGSQHVGIRRRGRSAER